MRIAQIMLARGFGGAERSFVDLTRALVLRGHEVLAIGDPRGVALDKLADLEALTIQPVRCYGSWDRVAEYALRRALSAYRCDIVHAHLARAAHLGGRAAQALGIRALAKTHNLVKLRYYQHLDCLVPTTRAQEAYLVAGGIAAEKLHRIPNFSAIEPLAFIAPRAATVPFRLKALGRFVRKKGFDTLLDALALIVRDESSIVLDLAGEGVERARLQARIDQLGLNEVVHLHGWVEDVGAFLSGGDLFVLPSRDEPFGIALLEAMAAGIPIVATRTQGPLEILSDESAFFVDADDPSALAATIRRAMCAPDLSALAGVALERFKRDYSPASVVQAYLDLYQRLIDKTPPGS